MTVGFDAVGCTNQQSGEARGKENVSRNIQMLMLADLGRLMQGQVSPNGAGDGKRNTDQENIPPVNGSQNPTGKQADESSAGTRDHIDAHGQAALVGGEGICQDGSGVRYQEGTPDGLDQTENDDLYGGAVPGTMHQVKKDRTDCKDGKAEVVQAHPAEHIRDTSKSDQKRGSHDQITHESPQKVAGFPRCQGVDADATEDSRQ